MLSSEQRALVMHLVGEQIGGKGYDGLSIEGLADVLGRHYNTLHNWKKLPEVAEAVKRGVQEAETSKDYLKLVMRRVALEAMWANYTKSKESSEKRQYLKMVLEETKDAETDDSSIDFASKTDDELVELMLAADISPYGMTKETLAQLARREGGE